MIFLLHFYFQVIWIIRFKWTGANKPDLFGAITLKRIRGAAKKKNTILQEDKFLRSSIKNTLACCLVYHMGPEAHVYSSKSTNGGKGLQNSKINSYFTP